MYNALIMKGLLACKLLTGGGGRGRIHTYPVLSGMGYLLGSWPLPELETPAGVEPAIQPFKGCVLPSDYGVTRAKRSVELDPLLAAFVF